MTVLVTEIFFFALSAVAVAADTPREKIHKAFSLVGEWTMTKMDVTLGNISESSPSNVPEAAVGKVSINIRSALGESGRFTVDSSGNISGEGTAQYDFHVSAGSKAPLPFPWGVLPVGAAADLSEAGSRKFTITGTADLEKREISLKAFKPLGGPLKVVIQPGGVKLDIPPWPPMTNVQTGVIVNGATLLLRASGQIKAGTAKDPGGAEKTHYFNVAIEAVKYVNLAPLFEELAEAGARWPKGDKGDLGPKGDKGDPGDRAAGTGAEWRSGSIRAIVGQVKMITFDQPMTTDRYTVSLTPKGDATARWVTSYVQKQREGFSLLVEPPVNGPANTVREVQVDWIALPYH